MEWVRRHKSAFMIVVVQGPEAGGADAEGGVVARGGNSYSDSDFEQESGESDGVSPSPSSSSSGPGEHGGSEESDNEGGAGEGAEGSIEAEGNDEEIIEFDPKRRPLLRAAAAGATPKMSRAAVDAAVGLVVDDLLDGGLADPDHQRHPLHATSIDTGTRTRGVRRKTSSRTKYRVDAQFVPGSLY